MTRRRAGGRSAAVLALLFLALAPPRGAGADLTALEAGALTIHYPAGYATVATELARRGPGDLSRVAAALGLPTPEHLDVYVLPRRAAVDPSTWGLPLGPPWAAGLALSNRPVIILRTAEDVGPYGNEVARVLVHELVHAVASQGLGGRNGELPSWLREGTASYLSFDWRLVDAARSVRSAILGEAVPFAQLEAGFPADALRAQQAYLQSFSFVAWLVERGGPGALPEIYRRVGAGERFHPAFRATFGESVRALETRWRRRHAVVYRWIPVLTSTTTLWAVVTALVVLAGVRRRARSAAIVEGWPPDEAESDMTESDATQDEATGPPGPGESS